MRRFFTPPSSSSCLLPLSRLGIPPVHAFHFEKHLVCFASHRGPPSHPHNALRHLPLGNRLHLSTFPSAVQLSPMALTRDNIPRADQYLGMHWDVIHIFTHSKSIITLPSSNAPISAQEADALPLLFNSREYALRAGIVLNSQSFDVHQWESTRGVDLVYGRRGDAVSGAGACAFRLNTANHPHVYGAISYSFPSLSTNAVTKLVCFLNDLRSKLQSLPNSESSPVTT